MSANQKLAIRILTTLILALFFANYEMRLAYYEETQADEWTIPIIMLPFVLTLLYLFISNYFPDVISRPFGTKKAIKQMLSFVVGAIILFFIVLWPVISGFVLFLNNNLSKPTPVEIHGEITHRNFSSGKATQYELTIQNYDGTVYLFDVSYSEIIKHYQGDTIHKEMYKGYFGLVYLPK